MNSSIMDLSIYHLVFAYIFVLLLLVLSKIRGIRREKLIIIATVRMSLQLTIMGFVLMFVFKHPSWWLTMLMITIMLAFAIFNAIKRIGLVANKKLKQLMGISMIIGYICSATFFLLVVLKVMPWFNPQYCISISGMIIGNAMTGIVLGANTLCSEMQAKRTEIENSIMLGATPKVATHKIVNDAFDSAILPTINNMLTMGVVSLPGMMTGQILSGTFPITAIKYQIGIMLAILGCTALTVIIFVTLGYQTFFTPSQTLDEM